MSLSRSPPKPRCYLTGCRNPQIKNLADSVSCCNCKRFYHRTCVNARSCKNDELFKCDECKQKDNTRKDKVNNKAKPDKQNAAAPSEGESRLDEQKYSVEAMEEKSDDQDFSDIVDKLSNSDLKAVFTFLWKKLDSIIVSNKFLAEKYEETKRAVKVLDEQVKKQQRDLAAKEGKIAELNIEIQRLNQYSRKENVELHGVEMADGETEKTLYDKVIAGFKKVGMEIPKTEISIAHRLPDRKSPGKPPIIVRLKDRKVRNTLLTLSRASCKGLPPTQRNQKVRVMENISPYYKKLLYDAKTWCLQNQYEFSWFANGKVLVKAGKNSKTVKIDSVNDLESLEKIRHQTPGKGDKHA